MKNKKLLICFGIVVILAIVAFEIHKQKNSDNANKVVNIGVILPLTGPMGAYGERLTAAIRLAEEGQDDVKFLIEDGKYTTKDSISAFNKLKSDNVDAWIVFGDLPLLGMKTLLAESQNPVLCLIGAPDLIKDIPHLIHYSGASSAHARELGDYAGKAGIKSTVVIYQDEELNQSLIPVYQAVFEKNGGQMLAAIPFMSGQQDLRAVVVKAMSLKSESILVFGYGKDYVNIMNELVQQKYNGIILSDSNTVVERKNLISGGEGFVYVDFDFNPNSEYAGTRKFISDMQSKYKVTPCVFSAFAYEAAKNLIEAIQTNGKKSEEIEKYLYGKGEFQSVIGKIQCVENDELKVTLNMKKVTKDGDIILRKGN